MNRLTGNETIINVNATGRETRRILFVCSSIVIILWFLFCGDNTMTILFFKHDE